MKGCPLCGSEGYKVWSEKNYHAYKCRVCKVVFLWPIPDNPEVLYSEDYFRDWYIKYYSQRKLYISQLFQKMQHYMEQNGKLLLDVGCGVGFFMEVATAQGYQVAGQDVSPFAVDFCRDKGFEVYDISLPELFLPKRSFDVITMFDVIAHLKDPISYIETCRSLLKPGGYLVIKTPYHSSLLFSLARVLSFTCKSRILLHIPAQIYHFNKHTFKTLAEKKDFSVIACLYTREFIFPLSRNLKIFLSDILKRCCLEKSILVIFKKNDG